MLSYKKKKLNRKPLAVLSFRLRQRNYSIGKVIAVGPKCESGLKVGDKVVFKQYSGTKVTLDEVEYTVIDEEDILASVE